MKNKWKVLLIDDDPGIRKVLSIALLEAGYTVVTAPDGATGVKVFQAEAPHIVITDIGMPGIDGLEVLRRIKELDQDKEVIVTTAFTEIGLAVRAMQLDASGFVTKPVGHEALTQALRRAQERYRRRKELKNYTALMEEKWMDTAEELARTFLFQKTMIESSIDGLLACDGERNVIIFNESMEAMLGFNKADMIGKQHLEKLFAPDQFEGFWNALSAAQGGGKHRLFPHTTNLLASDGESIPVLLSATAVFQGQERIGLVIYCRDLRVDRSGKPQPEKRESSA